MLQDRPRLGAMRTVLALILLAACGPAPSRSGNFQESISVVAVCSNNTYGWIVEVEEGVPGMPDVSCSGFARSFADYQERCIAAASSGLAGFGALGAVDTSRWTVRVRAD